MASTINASTLTVPGLVYTADGTGDLALQSNGTTGITVSTGGNVTCANTLSVTGTLSATGNTTLGNANVNSSLIVKGPTNLANGTVTSNFTISGSTITPILKSTTSSPPTIQNSSGTEIGTLCRAWVNFNGTGVVAIRASFNVSSITDNNTGNYTVNFASSMPDANYATTVAASRTATDLTAFSPRGISPQTSSGATVVTGSTAAALQDAINVYVAFFR